MSEKNKQRNEVRTHGNNLLFSAYKKLIIICILVTYLENIL